MKTGFDLDGVVIRDSLGITRSHIVGTFLNYYFFSTQLGKLFYQFRQPDRETRSWLESRKRRGEEIIIISGTNCQHRSLVERWLTSNRIPYNLLFLKEREEKISLFKARTLLDLNCAFYLDDDLEIAQKTVQRVTEISGKPARIRPWQRGRKVFYLLKLN